MAEEITAAPVAEPAAPAAAPSPAPDPAPADPAPTPAPAADNKPEPTDVPPATPSPAMPDHGIDPDNPPDPDAGDQPPDPDHTTADEAPEAPDLKNMSRAERASYFKDLQASAREKSDKAVNDAYQPEPLDELKQKYLDQGMQEFEATMMAREDLRDQETQIAQARAQRAELNASLASDAMETMGKFDWTNPTNKDAFDEKSADAAAFLYDALCVSRDVNTAEHDDKGNPVAGTGQVIATTMMPSQFYGLIDQIRNSGNETAKITAQKAAEEQLGAVAPSASNTNQRDKPFADLSTKEQRERLQAQGFAVT